jgi:hypothetical protein
MAIDASIPLNIRPVQFQYPDRGQAIARAMQIQGLGNQNRLAELQFASAEREQQQADKLNAGYQAAMNPDGTIDRNKLYQYIATEGLGSKLPDIQKTFSEQDSAALESETKKFELGLKKFDAMGQVFGAVSQAPTVENAQAAITQLVQIGALSPEQGQQALTTIPQDPAQIKALADKYLISSLDAKDQLEQQWKQRDFDYRAKNDDANRGVTIRGQDITMRGQDMTRDTAIRGQDISRSTAIRGQDLTNARAIEANTTGKAPSGYRYNAQGNLEAIPGGPADKSKTGNMTEQQGKANLFGTRAEKADQTISSLEGKYSPLAINVKTGVGGLPLVGAGAEVSLNKFLLNDNDQMAEQAQRDFVNAVLRQESGAVISEQEFDNAKKQYFPQPGDSEAVIKQKKTNRLTAINGLKAMAGQQGQAQDQVIDFNDL